MKLSGTDFERRVADAIANIEKNTAAEIVVVVAPKLDAYRDVSLVAGLMALIVTFSALMFVDAEVGDYTLYAAPLGAFFCAFGVVSLLAPLQRALVGRRRRRINAEVWARATFQKASLHRTRDNTALLVFVAMLERTCFVVRDHGVAVAAADDEWRKVESELERSLTASSPGEAFLSALAALGELLANRLPARPEDVDELPGTVRVTFG